MSIRVGFYDFFSYLVPGGLYFFTIGYFCIIFGVFPVDFQMFNNFIKDQILLLAFVAYILGFVFDPISKPWYHLYAPLGLEKIMLDEFKSRHNLDIKFQPNDWPILLAYIRQQNLEAISEIEKLNALKIMLRNISFGLIILTFLTFVQLIWTNFYIWNLILCLALATASIITGKQAAKFDKWFFISIYQTIASYRIEVSDLITPKQENKSAGS